MKTARWRIRSTGFRRPSTPRTKACRSSSARACTVRTSILLGKNIRLVGTNPDQPEGSPFPVIEGADAGAIVSFTSGEGPRCELTGFVLTRGAGVLGSAVYCDGSSPTIANCLIVGNRSTHASGAAVYCRESRAAFANCTIADNIPGSYGAAMRLVNSSITMHSSILWNNGPAQILADRQQRPSHPVQQHRGRMVRCGDHLAGPAVRRRQATGPIRTISRKPRRRTMPMRSGSMATTI